MTHVGVRMYMNECCCDWVVGKSVEELGLVGRSGRMGGRAVDYVDEWMVHWTGSWVVQTWG